LLSAEDYTDSEPQHHGEARCWHELIADFQADACVWTDPSLCSATGVEQAEGLAARHDGQTSVQRLERSRPVISAA